MEKLTLEQLQAEIRVLPERLDQATRQLTLDQQAYEQRRHDYEKLLEDNPQKLLEGNLQQFRLLAEERPAFGLDRADPSAHLSSRKVRGIAGAVEEGIAGTILGGERFEVRDGPRLFVGDPLAGAAHVSDRRIRCRETGSSLSRNYLDVIQLELAV